jgi:flagellar hook-length control protein FliK
MTTNPASSRTPGDRSALCGALAAGSARCGEARASKTPGDASRAPGERFGTTMSRALERAVDAEARDDPGTEAPDDAKAAARDDSAAGTDAVAALLASADAASIVIPAPVPASAAEPVPAAAAGGDTPAPVSAADGDALASAQDAALRAASLGAAQSEGRNGPLAATTKAGADAGTDADAVDADAVDAGTNDAPASTLFGTDASVDSAGKAASAASSSDAAAARASHDFAAQLAHARAASASGAGLLEPPRGASAPPTHTPILHAAAIATPLHAAAFPAHFAAEVAMLGAAGIERAEIQLQPPDLGPVRIELTLSGESTRVAFSAVQPETRQAIEQSLPILKDLLAERGLTLGDTSVSDGGAHAEAGAGGNAGTGADGSLSRSGAAAATDGRDAAGDARRIALRRSLLDVYA